MKHITIYMIAALMMMGCGNAKKTTISETESLSEPMGPAFSADSALLYCQRQCDFGPRTMNSEAHELCAEWIINTFKQFGLTVITQKATLTGYDGTPLKATNIIASLNPEAKDRIMLCAHWDSRPWADNDPDEANHKRPVMAANDGASGVGVMLEIARLLKNEELRMKNEEFATAAGTKAAANSTLYTLNSKLGIDFICFDAEDWGTPQWAENTENDGDTWALGAQYWAANPHLKGYKAQFGILLDMVGGQGARFYQESYSLYYANNIVKKVWRAADTVGFGSYFPNDEGGMITDDHVPVNKKAGIPCIDIIPCYPDCEQSSFGPTWHTVNDDMQHLDKSTLQAVGQTLIQVIFETDKNSRQ